MIEHYTYSRKTVLLPTILLTPDAANCRVHLSVSPRGSSTAYNISNSLGVWSNECLPGNDEEFDIRINVSILPGSRVECFSVYSLPCAQLQYYQPPVLCLVIASTVPGLHSAPLFELITSFHALNDVHGLLQSPVYLMRI